MVARMTERLVLQKVELLSELLFEKMDMLMG